MSKQPDALRLADDLTKYLGGNTATQAAAELRRLSAENQRLYAQHASVVSDYEGAVVALKAQHDELLAALRLMLASHDATCPGEECQLSGVDLARAAIAKAQQLLEVTPAQMAHAEAIAKREQT